jgi:tetratricopeptide (TPR) repeat protein
LDRSKARRALGDTLGALADITEAVKLDEEYYWNYIDRGRLLIELRRKEEALADFNKAVEIDPDYFIAYVYRAGLNYKADNINAARKDYEKVIEKKQDYHFAYGPLGGLYFVTDNWSRSAEMFQKAYEYDNFEYSYILLKALALKQGAMEKEARKYLEEMMKQLPGKSWYHTIARYLAGAGSEFAAVNAANKEKDKIIKGQMLFYLGSQFLREGKTIAGSKYLIEARDIEGQDILERRIAHWLLLEDNQKNE